MLNVNGQRMVKLRQIILQMIFRVYLVEHLLGIVLHVFIPFFPFTVLSAKLTHRISSDKLFPYLLYIEHSKRARNLRSAWICYAYCDHHENEKCNVRQADMREKLSCSTFEGG
jgi:hypothetical protein